MACQSALHGFRPSRRKRLIEAGLSPPATPAWTKRTGEVPVALNPCRVGLNYVDQLTALGKRGKEL